jgi:hypothetical protein
MESPKAPWEATGRGARTRASESGVFERAWKIESVTESGNKNENVGKSEGETASSPPPENKGVVFKKTRGVKRTKAKPSPGRRAVKTEQTKPKSPSKKSVI